MPKTRGVLIAGNWKMNLGHKDTDHFFSSLRELAQTSQDLKDRSLFESGKLRACLAPPFLSLERARTHLSALPFPLTLAAQNAHWEKKGAFTGEISGPMLQEIGIHWALVGHSERRQFFGETDLSVRKRTESLLEQGFHVILCIGETKKEREEGQTRAVLTRQLNEAIPTPHQGAALFLNGTLIVAYEPVWAIGTGETATPSQAEEMHQLIRKHLWERFGMEASGRTSLLYGGSVTPENIDSLLECANIDGALVGGASLKPESFMSLLQAGARIS